MEQGSHNQPSETHAGNQKELGNTIPVLASPNVALCRPCPNVTARATTTSGGRCWSMVGGHARSKENNDFFVLNFVWKFVRAFSKYCSGEKKIELAGVKFLSRLLRLVGNLSVQVEKKIRQAPGLPLCTDVH